MGTRVAETLETHPHSPSIPRTLPHTTGNPSPEAVTSKFIHVLQLLPSYGTRLKLDRQTMRRGGGEGHSLNSIQSFTEIYNRQQTNNADKDTLQCSTLNR